jgi:hypothetical protein
MLNDPVAPTEDPGNQTRLKLLAFGLLPLAVLPFVIIILRLGVRLGDWFGIYQFLFWQQSSR